MVSERENVHTATSARTVQRLANQSFHFGSFHIDQANATLTHNGDVLSLTPKAFAVLCYLVASEGRLATRDDIFEHIWSGTIVTDAALTVCIREIRAALGDDAKNPRYIETVKKRGYRFIGQACHAPSGTDLPRNNKLATTKQCVVGRDDSFETLQNCKKNADTGARQLVFVTGEPGIGKTTAIETFICRQQLSAEVWIAKGQCIEHFGDGEAYLPILDALGDLNPDFDSELTDILATHAPTWLEQLPALRTKLNSTHEGQQTAPAHPERMLREITGALEVIARQRLLILILEDLHWSDHASIDLLSFLARRNNPARLLIISSYRPTDALIKNHPVKRLHDDLRRRGHCTTVPLQFLEQHHITTYLLAEFPEHNFPENFSALVHRKCEGNPLFMVNLLSYLQGANLLEKTERKWRLAKDFASEDIRIPDTVQLMIDRQIEQLSPTAQELLEGASVASEPGGVATRFTLIEVAAALSIDEMEVDDGLERLARNNVFLRPLGTTEWPDGSYSNSYEFTHALYQEVLYTRISAMRKVRQHRRLGLRLEIGFGPRSDSIAHKLAVHFDTGREYGRAVKYLLRVAETGASRGAYREAIHALEHADRLLVKLSQSDERDRLEIAVLLLLPSAITASHGNATPAIEQYYLRACRLCERTLDQTSLFRALFGLRSFYTINGDLDKAFEQAHTLLGLATALNNKEFLLEAYVGLANCEFFAGDHRASHTQALKGISIYDRREHAGHALLFGLDPGVFCNARAGQTAWFLGFSDQALQFAQKAVEIAEALQHPYSLVLAIHNHTQILCCRRDTQASLDSAQRGKLKAIEHGFTFLHAWALYLNSWALALNGSTDASLAEIEHAREAKRPKSALADSYLNTFLVEAYFHLRRTDEGLACLAAPTIEHAYDTVRSCLKAELVALSPESPAVSKHAENLFNDALTLSRQKNTKAYELRASIGLVKILMQRKDYQQAYDNLSPVVEWYKEGFDTTSVQEAQQLVIQLKKYLHEIPGDANVVYLQTDSG